MTSQAPGSTMAQEDGAHRVDMTMTTEQLKTLRRLALNDQVTTNKVMGSDLTTPTSIDARAVALMRLVALLTVDSDPATFRWAIDVGVAAGVEDGEIFDALMAVAPIIGTARLNSALPHLMEALDLDVLDE